MLEAGQLFFALRGDNHDGHEFVGDAIAAGAQAVVVEREPSPEFLSRATAVIVPDTLQALADLAAWHRSRFDLPVIAVTGSTGKTTTKEMLAAILSQSRTVLASVGTENNEVGVPRTLLRLGAEHDVCVLEFAMRGLREIAYLAEIGRPFGGVVTNVAEAHIGRLRSRRRIAAAKAELASALPPEGFAVLNADDDLVTRMDQATKARILRFGLYSPADLMARDLALHGPEGSDFRVCGMGRDFPVHLALPGLHNVYNALAAATAALALRATPRDIKLALADFEPLPRRGQILRHNGCVIVDDSYNASPASVRAILSVISEIPVQGRRIVVLGDMLELGEGTEPEHRAVGRSLVNHGVSLLVTVGPASRAAAAGAREVGVEALSCDDQGGAVQVLRERLQPGDLVVVKGSRRMGMDGIVRELLGD
jgi:UDP-N-acetylmuramoyl-tripeptide--D-alanyl-D-alanine ligase